MSRKCIVKTRVETESDRSLELLNLLNSLLSILGLRLHVANHVISKPIYAVQTVDREVDVHMQTSREHTVIGYVILDKLEKDLREEIQFFKTRGGQQIKNPYLGCRCIEEMLVTRDLIGV